jgi:hypothetical protein
MIIFVNHRYMVSSLTGILFLLIFCSAFAQQSAGNEGEIRIVQDEKVDMLVNKHIQINQEKRGMEGYRIQIFFDSGTNSKTRAQTIFESFKGKYPETGAYLTFKAPNYKVRVGDFRTKLDAQRYLNSIIGEYPNAWVIEDMINLPKVE